MKKPYLLSFFFFLFSLAQATTQDQDDERKLMTLTFMGVFVLIGLAGGIFALYIRHGRKRNPKPSFSIYLFQQPVLWALGLFLVVSGVVSGTFEEWSSNDLPEILAHSERVRDPQNAAWAYKKMLDLDERNIDLHFKYLEAAGQFDEWAKPSEVRNRYYHLTFPATYYKDLRTSMDMYMRNIGHFGLGTNFYSRGYYGAALEELDEISNETMPYVCYIKGKSKWALGEFHEALDYFKEEINRGGYISGGTRYIQTWFVETGDFEGMQALASDSVTAPHITAQGKMFLATHSFDVPGFYQVHVQNWLSNLNIIGVVGAFLGMLIWLWYLRQVDFFRREKIWKLSLVVLGGALSAFLATYLYAILKYLIGFDLNGAFLNDLGYTIFGIGVIEETVKMLPWLIAWRIFHAMDEPIDFLIYAGASALGFSLVENMMYFDEHSISVIFGRVLICIIFHIVTSSIIAFGVVKTQIKRGSDNLFRNVGLAFLASISVHGLYDFFLMWDEGRSIAWVSFMAIGVGTLLFAWMVNAALNFSPFFDEKKPFRASLLASILVAWLIGIFTFEYFSFSLVYGAAAANVWLPYSIVGCGVMMFFISFNLSNIDLIKGKYPKFAMWNLTSRVDYQAAIDLPIEIKAFHSQSQNAAYFPMKGKVSKRITVGGDSRFYLVELSEPLAFANFDKQHIVIRSKSKGDPIITGADVMIGVWLIKKVDAIVEGKLAQLDTRMIGWAKIN